MSTPSTFRSWIRADGSSTFRPESGRYHLYVSLACPYAHRTIILRKLKGLEDVISLDIVDFTREEEGWRFNPEAPGCTPDTVNGFKFLRDIYFQSDPNYSGRFTVPVLYDKKTCKIVNNESSEIIRMLNSEFNEFCSTQEQRELDLYPASLRKKIDDVNEWIFL